MTDYFALLEQPRQPWLDPDELKQKYYRLTLAAHPDTQAELNPKVAFAEVNKGYQTLSDPKQRLLHLLTLERQALVKNTQTVPADLGDLFLDVGQLNQEIGLLFKKRGEATSGLGKSMLTRELVDMENRVKDQLDRLHLIYERHLGRLRDLNETWRKDRADTLSELTEIYGKISYLSRWIEQLEEKHFQFSQR